MRRLSLISLVCGLGLLVVGGASAGKSSSAKTGITASPAYSAAALSEPAGGNWLVVHGNLKGWRYSSLTQINKSNVGTLKQAWHISLGVCAKHDASCGSMESNPVVADGVAYTAGRSAG